MFILLLLLFLICIFLWGLQELPIRVTNETKVDTTFMHGSREQAHNEDYGKEGSEHVHYPGGMRFLPGIPIGCRNI